MNISSKREVENVVVDQEWVQLLATAKDLGISPDTIRRFLKSQKEICSKVKESYD